MGNDPIPEAPPKIALSLSGGGYRAAAFHLGVLSMLHRLDLLQHVRIISMVSGGSIIGGSYLVSLKRNFSFPDFYDEFYQKLRTVPVVALAMKEFGSNRKKLDGRVIRAFAAVFHREFAGEASFDLFWRDPAIHVREIIFNATEFQTGHAFRFRKSDNNRVRSGNKFFPVPQAVVRELRLGDVMAASACFPGGFEAMKFPEDFGIDPEDSNPDLEQKPVAFSIPVMDGGAFDNQGIESLLLTGNSGLEDTTMLLFSDAHPRMEALYSFPPPKPAPWLQRFTLGDLRLGLFLLFFLSLISIFIGIFLLGQGSATGLARGFAAISLLASISVCTGLVGFYWLLRKTLASIPILDRSMWTHFRGMPLFELVEMIRLRTTSLFALTSNVFMKRIRGLILNSLFRDERFINKIVPALIYDLISNRAHKFDAPGVEPSARLQDIARRANELPTTLWFDREEQLQDAIICGQATACYNLLKHLKHLEMLGLLDSSLEKVKPMTEDLYNQLQENPSSLLKFKSPGKP